MDTVRDITVDALVACRADDVWRLAGRAIVVEITRYTISNIARQAEIIIKGK